jgi:hypothetical protein
VSLLLLAAVGYSFGIKAYRQANPQKAFASLVGAPLPAGVRAVSYESAVTDNFLHTTHFWLLEGDTPALQAMALAGHFARSDEDARYFVPDAAAEFGMELTPLDLAEGYESDHPRNRWFLILKDRRQAIFVQ